MISQWIFDEKISNNLTFFRLGARSDVQWRVRFGEPSSGSGVQVAPERRLRHLRQHDKEATPDAEEDGHRHGPVHRHVQAHVSAGGFEDHGGNEEGGGLRCPFAGQLHRSDPGSRESGSLRRPVQSHETLATLSAMGWSPDGGVLPSGRPRTRAEHGHQPDVRQAQRHRGKVAGRLHRLHRSSSVGDLGRPGSSGRSGYPGHVRGESRLVPIDDSSVAAVRWSTAATRERTAVWQDTLPGKEPVSESSFELSSTGPGALEKSIRSRLVKSTFPNLKFPAKCNCNFRKGLTNLCRCFQVTLEEGDETGEAAETGDTGGAAKTTLSSEEGGGETEENAAEAGMWRRLAGICRKLHEKVQQTWWRVRQWQLAHCR